MAIEKRDEVVEVSKPFVDLLVLADAVVALIPVLGLG